MKQEVNSLAPRMTDALVITLTTVVDINECAPYLRLFLTVRVRGVRIPGYILALCASLRQFPWARGCRLSNTASFAEGVRSRLTLIAIS